MKVTKHNADHVTKQRHKRLEIRQAELHRCEGCGSWLYAQRPCTACPAIAAERAERARVTLKAAS